jgi:chromosome segregation ATPase
MVAETQASDEAARLSPAMLDRVRETMRALAGDEALQAEFAAGRVVRDHRAVGFGGATAAPAPRRAKKRAERSAKERAARKRRIERAERARDTAARRFREAQQRLDRAETAVEKARTRVAEAETKFAAAEEELGESRAEN